MFGGQGGQQALGARDLRVLVAQFLLEARAVALVEVGSFHRLGNEQPVLGQQLGDGQQKFLGVDRLFHKTDRADLEGEGFVSRGDVGGREHDDGDVGGVGVGAQVLDEGITVHPGHEQVGDDESRELPGNDFQGFHAVAGGDHRVALETQGDLEQLEHVGHVFHNQYGAIGDVHGCIVVPFGDAGKRTVYAHLLLGSQVVGAQVVGAQVVGAQVVGAQVVGAQVVGGAGCWGAGCWGRRLLGAQVVGDAGCWGRRLLGRRLLGAQVVGVAGCWGARLAPLLRSRPLPLRVFIVILPVYRVRFNVIKNTPVFIFIPDDMVIIIALPDMGHLPNPASPLVTVLYTRR